MKTAAEWDLEIHSRVMRGLDCKDFTAMLQAIIDDARAGMVPEGDAEKRLDALGWKALDLAKAAIEKHEAELAKAWEAGRDAAADYLKAESMEFAEREIRALQPPGGKAK